MSSYQWKPGDRVEHVPTGLTGEVTEWWDAYLVVVRFDGRAHTSIAAPGSLRRLDPPAAEVAAPDEPVYAAELGGES